MYDSAVSGTGFVLVSDAAGQCRIRFRGRARSTGAAPRGWQPASFWGIRPGGPRSAALPMAGCRTGGPPPLTWLERLWGSLQVSVHATAGCRHLTHETRDLQRACCCFLAVACEIFRTTRTFLCTLPPRDGRWVFADGEGDGSEDLDSGGRDESAVPPEAAAALMRQEAEGGRLLIDSLSRRSPGGAALDMGTAKQHCRPFSCSACGTETTWPLLPPICRTPTHSQLTCWS